MPYEESELGQLLMQLRMPFRNRDKVWDERRDVRFRRKQSSAPAALEALDKDVKTDYRSPLPGFVITRLVNRLGANDLDLSVRVRSRKPTATQTGEKIEDWLRGAQSMLDPMGLVDQRVREHQVADGDAFFELELLPSLVPPRRGALDEEQYIDVLDDAQRQFGLPMALSAPDPRSLYYIESRGDIPIIAKVVNKPLVDCRMSWSEEGFRIAYLGDGSVKDGRVSGTLSKAYLGGDIAPVASTMEYGILVRLVVICTPDYIYHCMGQQPAIAGTTGLTNGDFGDTGTTAPSLVLLKAYPNPIGRVPFFRAAARQTADADPAYATQPLAMEVLDLAPYVNTWRETRMVRGRIQANAPIHFKPDRPPRPDDATTPKALTLSWQPSVWEAQGTFQPIQLPDMPDFDVMDKQFSDELNSYNLSLMGAANQGIIGRSAPAWTVMQINEEQVGFMKDTQNARANAWRQVLMEGVIPAVKKKYAKDGPIYVLSDVVDKKNPARGHQADMISATVEDFSIPFDLQVTIRGETQSQAAAHTEYWRELRQEGSVSQETYETEIGITDRVAEQARKDQEAIEIPARAAGLKVGAMIGFASLRPIYGSIVDLIGPSILQMMGMNPVEAQAGMQALAESGNQPGGWAATPLLNALKMPGQGMSTQIPAYGGARNVTAPQGEATGVG